MRHGGSAVRLLLLQLLLLLLSRSAPCLGAIQRGGGGGTRASSAATRARYDGTSSIFSPDGQVYQVEYAGEAVARSSPAIGICTSEGIVLCARKGSMRGETSGSAGKGEDTRNSLQDRSVEGYRERLSAVDSHVMACATGLTGDAMVLLRAGRRVAQGHRITFQEPIPVADLTGKLADAKQAYTQYGGLRPWGLSLLLAGFDERRGLQLYKTDPTGNFGAYHAVAVGSNATRLTESLAEAYDPAMSLGEAALLASTLMSEQQGQGGSKGRAVLNRNEEEAGEGERQEEVSSVAEEEEEEVVSFEMGTVVAREGGGVDMVMYSDAQVLALLQVAAAEGD